MVDTKYYYSRYAMGGWILVAVIIGGIFELDKQSLRGILSSITKENASLAGILFAAIIGIGAPPAVGFLLERISSLLFMPFNLNILCYPKVQSFSASLTNAKKSDKLTGSAPFHICFYSYANPILIDWHRRRRTQLYASMTSFLAIIIGLIIVSFITKEIPCVTFLISFISASILLLHAIREGRTHREVISAWAESFTNKFVLADLYLKK